MKYTIVKDGTTCWVAESSELLAYLQDDDEGWTKTRALGLDAFVEKLCTEDEEMGIDAYVQLCNSVPAVDIEPDADTMDEFTLVPHVSPNNYVWTMEFKS